MSPVSKRIMKNSNRLWNAMKMLIKNKCLSVSKNGMKYIDITEDHKFMQILKGKSMKKLKRYNDLIFNLKISLVIFYIFSTLFCLVLQFFNSIFFLFDVLIKL